MVVRMRHTRSHTANRRSHHALKGVNLSICKECGNRKLPHAACPNCGKYEGREVVVVTSKITKKEKSKKTSAKMK